MSEHAAYKKKKKIFLTFSPASHLPFSSPLLFVIRGGCEYFFIFPLSFASDVVQLGSTFVLYFCFCVVRRHHRADFTAGCFPALGSAADVVVLASVLHRGKSGAFHNNYHAVSYFGN